MATVDFGSFVWSTWWIKVVLLVIRTVVILEVLGGMTVVLLLLRTVVILRVLGGIDGGRFALRMANVLLACLAKSI